MAANIETNKLFITVDEHEQVVHISKMHPRIFRLKKNLSIPQMAVIAGVTPRSVQQHEAGERMPGNEVVARIRRYSKGLVTADDYFLACQKAKKVSA